MIQRRTMPDGVDLLVRDWVPSDAAWLQLLFVHGVAEHSGRYEAMGQQLAAAGIAVRAFDLCGHGASTGPRGDVERWSDLTDDVGRLLYDMRSGADGRPVALMGHSMGGLIVLDAVLAGAAEPDVLVLSSPAIGDGLPRWQHLIAPIIAKIRPALTLANGWAPSDLSRDPGVGAAAAADPLQLDRATARLGSQGFAAQDRVDARLHELRIPTCVIQGSDDPLVPPSTTEALGELSCVTRVVYPRLRHETLFEPEGPEVVDDIIDWLRSASADPG